MLKNSMHAAQSGPGVSWLIGQSVGVMRLTYVHEIEGRFFLRKAQFAQNRLKVVMVRHELIAIESVIQDRVRIQHREGYASMCPISQLLLKKRRQVKRRN